jgi:hypothetical protein
MHEPMHAQRMSRRDALRLGGGALAGAWLLSSSPAAAAPYPPAKDRARDRGRGFPVRGPVVLTTSEMVDRAVRRVAEREEPFFQAWLEVRDRAEGALVRNQVPYNGGSHREYFTTGRAHARDARASALAFRITGDERYAQEARSILADWAADAAQNPDPAGNRLPPAGSPQGLVVGRVITVFADAYALIHHQLDDHEREAIDHWFALMVTPILDSQRFWVEGENLDAGLTAPYLGQQYFNNHLGAQTMGLAAIGYARGDQKLIRYALNSPQNPRDLQTLIDGAIIMPDDVGSGEPGDLFKNDPTYTEGAPAPEAGEIYDRYRIIGNTGLGYSFVHLRFLTVTAEMAFNNGQGRNYFDYVGPNGENLEVSYEFYADFLITGDSSARTGYYTGNNIDFGMISMYEIAHRHYPDNAKIREVLESRSRVVNDTETFGYAGVLTHGLDGLAPAPAYPGLGITEWDFENDGDLEGWRLDKSVDGEVSGGALNLTLTGDGARIQSPDELGVDADTYRYLVVRMRNETSGDSGLVYFMTDDDGSYSNQQRVGFRTVADDDQYRDYVIDLGADDGWTGRVKRLRFHPVNPFGADRVSAGSVSIDSIRFAEDV